MKKTLLTITSMALTVCAVAQVNGRIAKNSNKIFDSKTTLHSITAGVAATTCDTLSTITSTALSVPSWSIGYMFGTNSYGDFERANFFPSITYSTINTPMVSGVIVGFYKSGTEGTQGAATHTVGMNLYAGTSNSVAPGTLLGSTKSPFSSILSAYTNTASALFLYSFDFTSPVAIPSTGFYASVVLPNAAGDTVALVSQSLSSLQMNFAWDKFNDNSWHACTETPINWGDSTSLLFLPKVCGTVGISENLGLSKDVTIFPNPTSGLVNIAAILAEKTNLSVTVTNALGQTLVYNKYNGISNELLSLDLSSLTNGVYFVTVSNGTDKMVQRLVLNK